MEKLIRGIGVAILIVTMMALPAYAFSKCGWKTFLLGDGAFYAAFTGMCDE